MTDQIKPVLAALDTILTVGLVGLVGYHVLVTHKPKSENADNSGLVAKVEYAENANSESYNPAAGSNFCAELIANREVEAHRQVSRTMGFNEYSRIDANKAYVTKLTEIIANLKGEDYSAAAYAKAKIEFHNAVKEYSK